MRVMTSNIWGDFFGNEVSSREGQLYKVYKKYQPDILGLQEACGSWYKSEMFAALEKDGYLFLGTHFVHPEQYQAVPGAPLYEGAVSVPLLIKKDQFSVLGFGNEGLKDTPDYSKAITWAVLETKANKKVFGVCNTHFWWMERGEEDEQIRKENAKQLLAVMKQIHQRYQCPVFAFGDMNTRFGSEVFAVYEKEQISCLINEADQASDVASHHGNPVRGADGRFHGQKAQKDKQYSIDHIIACGESYHVLEYKVVEDQDALDATDHSPVYVDVELL